jgi:hypothetical protein
LTAPQAESRFPSREGIAVAIGVNCPYYAIGTGSACMRIQVLPVIAVPLRKAKPEEKAKII